MAAAGYATSSHADFIPMNATPGYSANIEMKFGLEKSICLKFFFCTDRLHLVRDASVGPKLFLEVIMT